MGRITPKDNSSPHGEYGDDWTWRVILNRNLSMPEMKQNWSTLSGIRLTAKEARSWGKEMIRLADIIEKILGNEIQREYDAIKDPDEDGDDEGGTVELDNQPLKIRVYGSISLPKKPGDSGYDIVASQTVQLSPFSHAAINTNVAVEMQAGMCALVIGRSSLNVRGIFSQVGLIDAGYRGKITVVLYNASPEICTIEAGDRIAQLVFLTALTPSLEYVNHPAQLSLTERGADGFGSTGQ